VVSAADTIWVDGKPTATLPLPDRGFDFGDGLFETLLVINKTPLFLNLHLQRMQAGLALLGFPDCIPDVSAQISLALESTDFPLEVVLRVTVTRGSGPRGYLPPPRVQPRIVIVSKAREGGGRGRYNTLLPPSRLTLAKIRWGCQPELAGIKHLNRLEQVLAARECHAANSDEVVMLDQGGGVISVSAGNLFMVDGDQLLTPILSDCGIRGTRRRLILEELGPALGLQTREARVTVAELEAATEVFYSNALLGVRPVASFRTGNWRQHKVCDAIHKLYWQRAL